MRIALTGNPNSGKTTMYNALTGRNEHVGNWAGVTVEKKESPIKKSFYDGTEELIAVDLPGAYSMSPFTSEESVTSGYIKNENPDVIINIVDATNLSRSLFFTTQLLELGIPVVVALNKSDINAKKENKIEEFNYVGFTTWLNKVLQSPLPENTKAINFNLYEEAQPNTFGIQCVATSSFELNNDDWACDEIFSSNENMYFFANSNGWEHALKEVEENVKAYLEKEDSSILKKYDGIGLGFVDGDLIIVYRK